MSLCFLFLSLFACSDNNDDLVHYIQEIKQREIPKVELRAPLNPFTAFQFPNPDDRRSPFKPEDLNQSHEVSALDRKSPKHVLAAVPLDALRFVGTLKPGDKSSKHPNELRALIQLPNAEITSLRVGDSMGQNNGRIVSINPDSIQLCETVHILGQWKKQCMVMMMTRKAQNNPLTEKMHQKKSVYSGERISLNFQNISIRAVLQLLADLTHINIVVSDKVQGTLTLRLNNTPWDEVLDIILTMQGLVQHHKGNVLLIDTQVSFDKMESNRIKSLHVMRKFEPIHSELIPISYAKAKELAIVIKGKQGSLLSEKGKISVDTRTNTLWIQDTATQIDEIRTLVKQLDVPVQQVLIEARIVEVSKNFAEDLGIRWGISRADNLSGTLAKATPKEPGASVPNNLPYKDRLNLDLVAVPLSGVTPASLGIALAQLGDNILLDLELSALESEGLAELISSPRLITANQQPAVIDSGQEVPYQESTASGATSVSFKKAVLSLKVIPQITADNKILMELKINQDTALTKTFNGIPAIATKEIQTNVLVNNGKTIVLGGIYQQDKSKTITRVPFLGELPVLGNLFKNTQIGIQKEELLIFITPRIVASE